MLVSPEETGGRKTLDDNEQELFDAFAAEINNGLRHDGGTFFFYEKYWVSKWYFVRTVAQAIVDDYDRLGWDTSFQKSDDSDSADETMEITFELPSD